MIINDETGAVELKSATLRLVGDEYVWIGLIPLGDFTANVSIGKTLLKEKFTNLKLLQQFQNRISTLIQVRSGGESTTAEPPQSKISQNISIPTVGTNPRVIHLLLVGSDNKLTAQYLGLPVSSWTVDVAEGTYKLLVIAYYQNGAQCRVYSRTP
jgi:hypothetical protein